MKEIIHSPAAPKAIGPYSQAVKVGKTIYFSGQLGLDPDTMTLVAGGVAAEAKQVFTNMRAIAQAAGGDLGYIAKLTIYLTDLAHFPVVNEIMQTFFTVPYPARTTIQVSALPKEGQIEVEAIMIL